MSRLEDFVSENITYRPIQTPIELQMEATECGAAALAIVLGYYGAQIPLERLRIECGVGRGGSKASHMIEAAKEYGLDSKSFEVQDIADLKHYRVPAILFWEFNHFVVLEGIQGKWVYINDPARGRVKYNVQEFGQKFTGVILCFHPSKDFKIRRYHTKSWFAREMKGTQWIYQYLILVSLFLVIPGLVVPGLSKIFVDDILIQHNTTWLPSLILGVILTACVRNILVVLQRTTLLKFKLTIVAQKSGDLIWKILHKPVSFFLQRFAGDICHRGQAFYRIGHLFSSQLASAFFNVFLAIFYGFAIFLYAWQIGLAILVVVGIIFLIYRVVHKHIKEASFQTLQLAGRLSGTETYAVSHIEQLKAQVEQDTFFTQWASKHAELIEYKQKLAWISQVSALSVQMLIALVNVLILILGAYLIIQGQMTAGMLVAVQSLTQSMFGPLTTLFQFGQSIEQIKGDIKRVEDISHYKGVKPGAQQLAVDEGQQIELICDEISFAYSPRDDKALQQINLNLKSNQHISIVGVSGSGKSTLAKLLVGLLRPTSGQITYQGVPIQAIEPGELQYHIGYVDQDVLLFEGTIRDNLTFWNETIPDEVLVEALAKVSMTTFLNQKGGLDFELEQGGNNISHGQKQRIEIARALLAKPKILILDEATASLDAIVEADILQALKSLGVALVTITHRLKAVQDADCIYLLEGGQLVDKGNHETLLATSERYRGLYSNE